MMTADEARDSFSEAFEGELDAERKAAFDAALATDPELEHEYAEFVETFQMMGRLGDADAEPAPDLLSGVQERLRKRSRGRYYRDQFSRRAGPGWALPVLLAVACILTLALTWYALHTTVILEEQVTPAPSSTEPATR
jgi:anti-sigma factor RsiW